MTAMPASALLSRRSHRDGPAVTLWEAARFAQGRVHEICGRARRTLALHLAGATEGPVLWIAPAWTAERLNPCGLAPILPPARLIFLNATRAEDLLWAAEEALRSGTVPLVVAELPDPPPLTPVRRLQLAAEASGALPLGVLLTPGIGGAAGVETRHAFEPAHESGDACWRLSRLRARMAPPRAWRIETGPGGLAATPTADPIPGSNLPAGAAAP